MSGKLLLVATPIGNLGDMSPRAVEALRSSGLILAEDTRHTHTLLAAHRIDVPMESFHEHNEDEKTARIVARIKAGETIALVSDAGTPVVSDPGFPLIRRLREEGLRVEPVPGASAVMLALAASGLPPSPFTFWGFAPHRDGERRSFYTRVAEVGTTAVIFESPQRVVESLACALDVLGDAEATVARELTKFHEELIHGTISEILTTLRARSSIRGEITLVIAPAHKPRPENPGAEVIRKELARLRGTGLSRNDALRALAGKYGLRKNELYRMLTEG